MTQQELDMVNAAIRDEPGAFDALFQYYYQMAYAMAFTYTKNDADAKDAVQEVFIAIHKSIKELREPVAFPAWLKTIVHSKCHKIFRKKHDIPADPDVLSQSQCLEQRPYMIPFDYCNNENEKDVIHDLIYQLKPKYRDIVELVYLKQMKIEEAAKMVGLSSGTVKTRLHRAKKDLSSLVRQFEKDNERKINFRADLLVSDSVLLILLHQMKSHVWTCKEFVSSNALITTCGVAMSVLMVSGGVMLKEDLDMNQVRQKDLFSQQESNKQEVPVVQSSNFPTIVYQEKSIQSSRSAYFTLVNFAMDEDEQSKEELLEIQNVYQALKQKNDAFYRKLVNEGFDLVFE